MTDAPRLRQDTLFLACTRPAMKLGVPMEAFYCNLFGTAFLAMLVGRGNPAYYLLLPILHVPLVILANRNPNFFHEGKMWLLTFGASIGRVLRVGGQGIPSSV